MKRRFSKILGVGLTLALITSLLLTAAPVSADVGQPSVVLDEFDDDNLEAEISASNLYTITFDVNDEVPLSIATVNLIEDGEGDADWTTDKAHSGAYSVELTAGTDVGDVGRVEILLDADDAIPIADFTGASYYVWEPTGTQHGGEFPYVTAHPYGDPYINIYLDLDGDEVVDDYLEGLGSVAVPASATPPATHPTPTAETWVEMEEGYGFYDSDSTLGASGWESAYDVGTLTEWKDYLDTVYPNCEVVGIKITFGYWADDVTEGVYVDDVEINGTTYNLDYTAYDDSYKAIDAGTITIEFPEGTEVDDDWVNADVEVQSTEAFGVANSPTPVGNHVVTTEDDDVYTVTIGLDQLENPIAEGASVRVKFLDDQITNPDDADDYTLWVSTSEETDLVESETYTIEVPEIEGLPGVVSVYNPSGILMKSYTGSSAIEGAIDKAIDEDWVIKIGPGTYGANDTFAADIAGVTFEAVGDVTWEGVASIEAADIVIEGITFDGDGKSVAVTVTDAGTGVSFEDCAFEDADILLQTDADDIAIDDCTFTVEDGVGINVIYTVVLVETEEEDKTTPPVITDCTFTVEEDGDGVGIDIAADVEVTDCMFNGGSGVGVEVNGGVSAIEGCTFDGLETAFAIEDGEVDIFGGTIQDCTDIAIDVDGPDKVLIHNNTITGSDDAVILDVATTADAGVVVMLFNDITDNAGDEDLLVNNGDDDHDLYVINNWWGDADGPSQGEDAFSDDVVYEPFLTGPVSDSVIDAAVAVDDGLDAEDECGVTVTADKVMDIVGAAKYAENPAAAIDDAVGFWDVCMIDDDVTSVTIRFYTDVTEDTEVYVWGEARGEWLQCDPDIAVPNLFSGFIAVTVGAATTPTLDDLGALPFAVVEPPAEAELEDAPELLTPTVGDDTVSLTPTFAWSAVDDADGYYFEFADNANFVTPLVKLDGDLGRLIVTAYAYVTELPYSTAYYWRVKAVSGTEAAGDLKESDWVSGLFITKAEPVEPTPPVVVEPYEPPIITIEQPDIVVPLPAETPITPAWIYVIIGVGAVLVIGLIVLIVRTRRVA